MTETGVKKIKLWMMSVIIVAQQGCIAHVTPWQRGNLAKPHMALEPESTLTVLREHVQVSKEASSGGSGGSGGGCGCN